MRIVGGSDLGKHIFGHAIEQVIGDQVALESAEALKGFLSGKKVVDLAGVQKAKRILMTTLQALPGSDMLPEKREVSIAYRGIQFSVKVSSLADEVDLRMAAFLKGLAQAHGFLPQLLCEDRDTACVVWLFWISCCKLRRN